MFNFIMVNMYYNIIRILTMGKFRPILELIGWRKNGIFKYDMIEEERIIRKLYIFKKL